MARLSGLFCAVSAMLVLFVSAFCPERACASGTMPDYGPGRPEDAYQAGKDYGWKGNKYSMFIHFGLYSELGGVWDGKPVTKGYSEQIQSFAGIFSDWYGEVAYSFDPVSFNADSLAALAVKAGMRSIVFTSKHHDGFCMYRTATTGYNSFDMAACHRDFVKEMSDACRKAGLGFGIYFSLIDWNYPQAAPISSHNADFITPEHHALNKAQVRELLTSYGPVSEFWFDMGSLTPEQSHELYDLVHTLQPDCMVSGRLGNDCYDFAVMADNRYPDRAIQSNWQTAASMFNETWGYRSWQERGDVYVKSEEKLRSLLNVVSHGGNYLLNIGPDGDGNVVPFERDVLCHIGKWLDVNGEAVYGTESAGFALPESEGAVTARGNRIYISFYDDGNGMNAVIPLSGARLEGYSFLGVPFEVMSKMDIINSDFSVSYSGDSLNVCIGREFYLDYLERNGFGWNAPMVAAIDFDRKPGGHVSEEMLPADRLLTKATASVESSYSCYDYYSNYRSEVAFRWNTEPSAARNLDMYYTPSESGKAFRITCDGVEYQAKCRPGKPVGVLNDSGRDIPVGADGVEVRGTVYFIRPEGLFEYPLTVDFDASASAELSEFPDSSVVVECCPFESHYIVRNIYSPDERFVVLDVSSGDGVNVFVNGVSVMKHLNRYRSGTTSEKVLVRLEKGTNTVAVKFYNRFERTMKIGFGISPEQHVYRTRLKLKSPCSGFRVDNPSVAVHSDGLLHNLVFRLR